VRQIAEAEKLDVVSRTSRWCGRAHRIDITDKVIKALAENRAGK